MVKETDRNTIMNKVTIKDLIQDAGNTALLAREEKDPGRLIPR